jgi:tetratricopeptide (TPR) repeat protein
MMVKWLLAICAVILLSSPVSAEWHEASSDHFVVYANQSEKQVRAYAERLERYHNAINVWLKTNNEKPSPSNRVTVYVVGSEANLKRLYGDKSSSVLGFYQSRAGGSVAFIPNVETLSEIASMDEIILLHEYAHHIMFTNSQSNYPSWIIEGFAEFYASAKFNKNGDVGLGLPANHRAYEYGNAIKVPLERLLDSKAYREKKSKSYDSFYVQSWQLFHYLTFEPSRAGQMLKYQNAIDSGESEMDAARTVFGDLKKLDTELDKYARKRMLNYKNFGSEILKPGSIQIRKLNPGEAAAMPVVMKSKRGVSREQALELLPQARSVAAQFPNEAAALAALSEAEFDAGNDKEAIAAADRATSINPNNVNAIIQKGYAMARQAKDSDGDSKTWKAVRSQFIKVNSIENDHPIPLIQFYRAYREQGIEPTPNAVEGLSWALALSPFDQGLRMNVASQYMEDKKYAEALRTLKPLLNSAHDGGLSDEAQKLSDTAKEKMADEQKPALVASSK